jgi:methylmalonyl-CoA/ethylmalonyl-CoA epimerase
VTAPRIDHIGIIVDDLDAAIERFSLLLGVASERRDLPEVELRIAEFRAENLSIELIAYDGSAELARRVMGSDPGINHITMSVDNVDTALKRLGAAGFRAQPGFPRRGAHGTVVFFERDAATGLLFELCAPDARKVEEPS